MSTYDSYYSSDSFWDKVKGIAKKAGVSVIKLGLELYYSLLSPNTPTWAKATAVGALGYFIFPIDLVIDFIPILGYTDDATVMTTAITSIGRYVTPEIKEKAQEEAEEIFN